MYCTASKKILSSFFLLLSVFSILQPVAFYSNVPLHVPNHSLLTNLPSGTSSLFVVKPTYANNNIRSIEIIDSQTKINSS